MSESYGSRQLVVPWNGDWKTVKLDPDQISYAGRANTNFKDRLVLRDGRGTDKLNICMNRFGVCEYKFQRSSGS